MSLERTRYPGIFKRGGHYVAVVSYRGADGTSKRAWLTRDTLTAAKDARRDTLNDLDRGIRPDGARITLAEYLEAWWLPEVERERRPATASTYSKVIRRYIVPAIGGTRLKDLGRDDLRSFYRSVPTPSLASLCHRVLSSALGHAVKDLDLLAVNPCASVRPPSYTAPEAAVLGAKEARRLLQAVQHHDLEGAVVLGLVGGLRVGEAVAVRWSDLDLDSGELDVARSFAGPTKSGKARTLTLPPAAIATLRRCRTDQAERLLRVGVRLDDNGLVVTDPLGRQMRPQALSAAFRAFAAANGFGITRFHSLRHSAAVMMLSAGVDVKTTSARLGHSDPALLFKTYSHRTDDADRAAAARLEVVLGE